MNVVMYFVPVFFTLIMLINGAIHYWGYFDKASTEAIFYHYVPSKREERNWKLSQKIYGKNLLVAGVLNAITEVILIPFTNQLLEVAEKIDAVSFGMMCITFLPSFVYMFGAWLLMQLKLKRLEDEKNRNNEENFPSDRK